MKGKDLEAEPILAPSVFTLGAQEKCKMEAKDIKLQGLIFLHWCSQYHIDNLTFDILKVIER